MSNHWDILCLDCNEEHGFDSSNHADDAMRAIVRAAPALAAFAATEALLGETLVDVEVTCSKGRLRTAWFAKHAGHRLAAVDEYGRVDGTCGKRLECECGRGHYCKRDKDHDGDCSIKAPKKWMATT